MKERILLFTFEELWKISGRRIYRWEEFDLMDRQPLKLITKSDVVKHLPMSKAIDCMESAFAKLSSGSCTVPARYITNTDDNSLTFLLKPAFVDEHKKSSLKILIQKNAKQIEGIPTILGIALLIDNITGEILSIIDGEYITALRTGAASGLATKYLSRPESNTLAIFGCGTQGRTQLKAVEAVRNIERIWVFDKSIDNANLFIQEVSPETTAGIEYTNDLSILKNVDIICTATNSNQPLFSRDQLKAGVHINAIGSFKPEMQEIDPEIMRAARIYLDDKKACINESGDILKAFSNTNSMSKNIVGEIGELVLNNIDGRTSDSESTLFKSVGNAIQDYEIAYELYKKSQAENFGQEIKLYE
jgi:ornithine cyclodeaminase/alanine dehydrogenase-like protein (mu-crystallin family)